MRSAPASHNISANPSSPAAHKICAIASISSHVRLIVTVFAMMLFPSYISNKRLFDQLPSREGGRKRKPTKDATSPPLALSPPPSSFQFRREKVYIYYI